MYVVAEAIHIQVVCTAGGSEDKLSLEKEYGSAQGQPTYN